MQIAAFFKKPANSAKGRCREGGEFQPAFGLVLQMDVFQLVELVGERIGQPDFRDWQFRLVADRRNVRTEKKWGTP